MFDLRVLLHGKRHRSPGLAEKRLHNRAVLHWNKQLKGNTYPLVEVFDSSDLEDFGSHGFMLDLTSDGEPIVREIGDVLREEADLPDGPARLHEIRPASLLGQFAGRYRLVFEEHGPVASEYVFTTAAGYRVSCRGVLLPLSTNGRDIDHVYGVVSWKSEKVAEGLCHEATSDAE